MRASKGEGLTYSPGRQHFQSPSQPIASAPAARYFFIEFR
jgi:hypothetical protein